MSLNESESGKKMQLKKSIKMTASCIMLSSLLLLVVSASCIAEKKLYKDLGNVICIEDPSSPKGLNCYSKVFRATNEFTPVLPGQILPTGLFVRMNLETGQQEARLMDENDSNGNDDNSSNNIVEKSNEVQQIIVSNVGDKVTNIENVEEEEVDKDREETLEAIVDEYIKYVAFEPESMIDSLQVLMEDNDSIENKIAAFENLDNIVRKIDFGKDFMKYNGFEIVGRFLLHPREILRRNAALVLGSALQSNLEVQETAYENVQFLDFLLERLRNEKDPETLSAELYTLGSLLRGYSKARNSFLASAGPKLLAKIASEHPISSGQLQRRCITILMDIIEEELQEELEENKEMKNGMTIKYLQKLNVGSHEWCPIFAQLGNTCHLGNMEHAINAFHVTLPLCNQYLLENPLHSSFLECLQNNTSEYSIELQEQLNNLVLKL